MKFKLPLLVTLFVFSLKLFAQNEWKVGQYVDTNNQTITGYILDEDWKNNPESINFKYGLDDKPIKVNLDQLTSFQILGQNRFEKHILEVDQSIDVLPNISDQFNPEFKTDTLLLKLLIDGEVKLFYYESRIDKKYFIQQNEGAVTELINKNFRYKDRDKFEEFTHYKINNTPESEQTYRYDVIYPNPKYRKQLWVLLPQSKYSISYVDNLPYSERAIKNYVKAYYEEQGITYKEFNVRKKTEAAFHVGIHAGIRSQKATAKRDFMTPVNIEFDNVSSATFSADLEWLLPFMNNRIGFFLQPTIQTYKAQGVYNYRSQSGATISENVDIVNNSFDATIGARYYFHLNDNSKVFLDAALILGFAYDLKFDFENRDDLELESFQSGFQLGGGYNYRNFVLSAHYYPLRNLYQSGTTWSITTEGYSIRLGYYLF